MLLAIVSILVATSAQAADPGCREPVTQTDMTACAYQDYERADAALNAQYKRTLAVMRARDTEFEEYRSEGDTGESYAALLLKAQRAWLALRDAQCMLESYEMRGGSAAPMILHGCRASLTEARTKGLAELAEGK